MSEERWARVAPLSGIVFVVLLVAGAVTIGNYQYLPPPEEIRSFFEDGSIRIQVGAYLFLVSAFFLVWFAGSLRTALRTAEGGTGRLSAVAFGGGVAAGGLILAGSGAMIAAAARAGSDGGIGAEGATTLFDLYGALVGNSAPGAFALLVGAAAVVSFRTRVFPAWLVWASAVVAVGLLAPFINYIFLGVALLWIVVVSILLFVRERLPIPAERPA